MIQGIRSIKKEILTILKYQIKCNVVWKNDIDITYMSLNPNCKEESSTKIIRHIFMKMPLPCSVMP